MAKLVFGRITDNKTETLGTTAPGHGFMRVYIDGGAFGGGTLEFGTTYEDSAGTLIFQPLADPAAVTVGPDAVVVEVGASTEVAVRLTGATSPDIGVAVSGSY